jgi:hypothetical protein
MLNARHQQEKRFLVDQRNSGLQALDPLFDPFLCGRHCSPSFGGVGGELRELRNLRELRLTADCTGTICAVDCPRKGGTQQKAPQNASFEGLSDYPHFRESENTPAKECLAKNVRSVGVVRKR